MEFKSLQYVISQLLNAIIDSPLGAVKMLKGCVYIHVPGDTAVGHCGR